MKKLFNHELAEIAIPANTTATKFNFPDLPNLKNCPVWGIQVYTVLQLPTSPMSGSALPTVVQVLNQSFITLTEENGSENLKDMPAALFNTLAFDLNTSTNLRENNAKVFNGQKINWTKSYVRFSATPGGASVLGYLLSINYTREGQGNRIGCAPRR